MYPSYYFCAFSCFCDYSCKLKQCSQCFNFLTLVYVKYGECSVDEKEKNIKEKKLSHAQVKQCMGNMVSSYLIVKCPWFFMHIIYRKETLNCSQSNEAVTQNARILTVVRFKHSRAHKFPEFEFVPQSCEFWIFNSKFLLHSTNLVSRDPSM